MSESIRRQKYYFGKTKSTGVHGCTVFVKPESSPAMEVLFPSSGMLADARSILFVPLSSPEWRPLFARQNKHFLRFADSRRGVFDDPMEFLQRARIQFRSTKQALLAREHFIKNVWNCTCNGFGARKLPAESTPRPNVLYLSSGMPQGAQTTVFVMFEDAVTLKVLISSNENSWPRASLKPLYS